MWSNSKISGKSRFLQQGFLLNLPQIYLVFFSLSGYIKKEVIFLKVGQKTAKEEVSRNINN